VLEASHRYGSLLAICTPGRGSFSRPYPSCCYGQLSIYPPIKDERLSRPEPTLVNKLPGVLQKCRLYQVSVVKPALWPTRHDRCEQLDHNSYAVTSFSGIWTPVFQTQDWLGHQCHHNGTV